MQNSKFLFLPIPKKKLKTHYHNLIFYNNNITKQNYFKKYHFKNYKTTKNKYKIKQLTQKNLYYNIQYLTKHI